MEFFTPSPGVYSMKNLDLLKDTKENSEEIKKLFIKIYEDVLENIDSAKSYGDKALIGFDSSKYKNDDEINAAKSQRISSARNKRFEDIQDALERKLDEVFFHDSQESIDFNHIYKQVKDFNPENILPAEVAILSSVQGALMGIVDEKKQEQTCDDLLQECRRYKQHLEQSIVNKLKKLPKKTRQKYQPYKGDSLIQKVVSDFNSLALYDDPDDFLNPQPKNNQSLDTTIKKYNQITELEAILEKEESPTEKLKSFQEKFKQHKVGIQKNSEKGKAFVKKVGAVLSCMLIIGLVKAFTSKTFFGKSHGQATVDNMQDILSSGNNTKAL